MLSTHPYTPDRIERMKKIAREIDLAPPPAAPQPKVKKPKKK
jgi:hypothetical protein